MSLERRGRWTARLETERALPSPRALPPAAATTGIRGDVEIELQERENNSRQVGDKDTRRQDGWISSFPVKTRDSLMIPRNYTLGTVTLNPSLILKDITGQMV